MAVYGVYSTYVCGTAHSSSHPLRQVLALFDSSGDGDISFTEYLDWWISDAKASWLYDARHALKKASLSTAVHNTYASLCWPPI